MVALLLFFCLKKLTGHCVDEISMSYVPVLLISETGVYSKKLGIVFTGFFYQISMVYFEIYNNNQNYIEMCVKFKYD